MSTRHHFKKTDAVGRSKQSRGKSEEEEERRQSSGEEEASTTKAPTAIRTIRVNREQIRQQTLGNNTKPVLSFKSDFAELLRNEDQPASAPSFRPKLVEQIDYSTELLYLEYVMKTFADRLEWNTYNIDRLNHLCLALTNDWFTKTLHATIIFIGCDPWNGSFGLVNGVTNSIREDLVKQTLIAMAQLTSQVILAVISQIISIPINFVDEVVNDIDSEKGEAERHRLLDTLNSTSKSWQAYLEALSKYYFRLLKRNNISSSSFLMQLPALRLSTPSMESLRQAASSVRTIESIAELDLSDIEVTNELLDCTANLF